MNFMEIFTKSPYPLSPFQTYFPLINYAKYPILKTCQKEVDIQKYANEIRKLFNKLQDEYGYNELDAILVLKDILAHEYLYNKNRLESII